MYVLNQDTGTGTQIKWLRTLIETRVGEETARATLKLLFDNADNLRIERNAYVHGIWNKGAEPLTATVQTVKLNRAALVRTELVTVPDLNEFLGELLRMASELHTIGKALGFIRP